MKPPITTELVRAYAVCPRRASFLAVPPAGADVRDAIYDQVLTERCGSARRRLLRCHELTEPVCLSPTSTLVLPQTNIVLRSGDLLATVDYLEVRGDSVVPYVCTGHDSPSTEDTVAAAFAGYVLAHEWKRNCISAFAYGVVSERRVKTSPLDVALGNTIVALRQIIQEGICPAVFLHSGCWGCSFHQICHREAESRDCLSLMGPLRDKQRAKLAADDINTISQLSLTYRPPRRTRKKSRRRPPRYQPALHALALKKQMIIVDTLPDPFPASPAFFLDLEGQLEASECYLAGVIVDDREGSSEYSFWADTPCDQDLLQALLGTLRSIPDAPIYHYGAFDARLLGKLSSSYGVDAADVLARMRNVNTSVYGQIYFPVYTNGLKDIGAFIGAKWPIPGSSSAHAVAWRWLWEDSRLDEYKQKLLGYNLADCRALRALVREINRIVCTATSREDILFADGMASQTTTTGQVIHDALARILRSGHAAHDARRLSLGKRHRNGKVQAVRHRSSRIRPDRHIRVRRRLVCPRCGNRDVKPRPERVAEATITDIVFSKHGCRRRVTRYYGTRVLCNVCSNYHSPKRVYQLWNRKYGKGLAAWCAHQRVVCRLPYGVIARNITDLFGIPSSPGMVERLIHELGDELAPILMRQRIALLKAPALYVDDTRLSTATGHCYVWVVTNGHHVEFDVTLGREAGPVLANLTGFKGVPVSDFFPGFDSTPFRQQKCWAHLTKDLNEALWQEPFDTELEVFVGAVRDLMVPIITHFNRYGPKAYHLRQFRKPVNEFFQRHIHGCAYESESVRRFRKRFLRYENSLFTFLSEDGVSWHNNTAERALRHVAVQRKISTAPFSLAALPSYLVLLSLAQTCRNENRSFLQYLLQKISRFA